MWGFFITLFFLFPLFRHSFDVIFSHLLSFHSSSSLLCIHSFTSSVCVCVCVELRCSLTCCIIHSLGPVRLIKVLGAERRAPSKYNFPSPLTQYIQHRQSQPRHGFDPPWGLDFPRPPVVTVFEINCLACQILYFQRHRGYSPHPVHLPPSNNVWKSHLEVNFGWDAIQMIRLYWTEVVLNITIKHLKFLQSFLRDTCASSG